MIGFSWVMWSFEDLRDQVSHLITSKIHLVVQSKHIFLAQLEEDRWIRAKTVARSMGRDHKPGRSLGVCSHPDTASWPK